MYNNRQNLEFVKQLKQYSNNSIGLINQYRDRIKIEDRYALLNHFEFINNLLTQMIPQATPFDVNDFELSRKIQGNNSINKSKKEYKNEWESQFDESLNLNPPCYIMPPQNVSGLNNLKKIVFKK